MGLLYYLVFKEEVITGESKFVSHVLRDCLGPVGPSGGSFWWVLRAVGALVVDCVSLFIFSVKRGIEAG